MSEREEKEERGRKAFEWLLDHPEFVPPTPPVSRAAGGETAKVCQCGGEPCIGPAMLRPGYYCSQAHRMNARIGVNGAWCYDCGLAYGTSGFADLVVPNEVWNTAISPTNDEGGLLCPTCLVARASNAGVRCEAVFRSGPFAARALSSAPAPEERPNPPSAREVSAMRDLAWRTLNEHDPEVDYEKVAEGLAGYVLHLLAASPSGAGSPVADNRAIVPLLMGHWLTAVECDHATNTDKACCWCGWASDSLPTVGDAVCAWAEHVASFAAPPAAGREPSEAEVERGVEGWRAWEHNGREDDETVVAMVRAILRAALGASAQANTGEGR